MDADCYDSRINARPRVRKQCLRRRFEMPADLGHISGKTLPGPDVERNTRPTPVLNLQPYSCVGLGVGVGIHAWFLPISRCRFPVNHPGTILPSNGESRDVLDTHRPDGSKYLHLLLPP